MDKREPGFITEGYGLSHGTQSGKVHVICYVSSSQLFFFFFFMNTKFVTEKAYFKKLRNRHKESLSCYLFYSPHVQ